MPLVVTVNLPPELEGRLRSEQVELDRTAKEALLVALYRRGELSRRALSDALELDRFETELVLKRHNVIEDLGTADEFLDDARVLRDLLNGEHR